MWSRKMQQQNFIQNVAIAFFYSIQFTTLLPEDPAPAYSGQLWILKNYQNCKWMNNVEQYLKTICELSSEAEKDIIEIIPMTSLCGKF